MKKGSESRNPALNVIEEDAPQLPQGTLRLLQRMGTYILQKERQEQAQGRQIATTLQPFQSQYNTQKTLFDRRFPGVRTHGTPLGQTISRALLAVVWHNNFDPVILPLKGEPLPARTVFDEYRDLLATRTVTAAIAPAPAPIPAADELVQLPQRQPQRARSNTIAPTSQESEVSTLVDSRSSTESGTEAGEPLQRTDGWRPNSQVDRNSPVERDGTASPEPQAKRAKRG